MKRTMILVSAFALLLAASDLFAAGSLTVATSPITFGLYDLFSPTDNTAGQGEVAVTYVAGPNPNPPINYTITISVSPNSGSINPRTMKQVPPTADALNYNVYTDANNRALAGLSMGGLEVMDSFMAYPDMFGYINVMSSGWFANNKAMYEAGDKRLGEIAPVLSKTVKYLIFTQGGPEDIAYANGKEMLKVFDKHNIKYEFSEMPGGHSWYVWRYDLMNFAQKAFK